MKKRGLENYQIVIKPVSGWFDLHLREVFQYKDLIFLLVKRNFISQYKQTILGPAWAVIQPLLTTVVFTFIFGNVAGLARCGSVPPFLFYMSGNIAWGYFSGCLTGTANTFIGNSGIMGKVYFPRLVMPISTVLTQFISFFIQFILLIIIYTIYLFNPEYHMEISTAVLLLPVLVLQMAMLGLGFGVIVSALTTKYRDLAMLLTFSMQLWMYFTPVAYSLSLFRGSILQKIILMNPMTSVIEAFRYILLGEEAGQLNWDYFGGSWISTVIVLFIGIILFSKVEKTFMDTI